MRLSLATAGLSLAAFVLVSPAPAQEVGGAGTQTNPNAGATQTNPNLTQNVNPNQARTAGAIQTNPNQAQNAATPGMEIEAVPEGWIRIATDTNNDGRYDRVEMIHVYDLEIARQNSAQRARGGSTQNQPNSQGQAIQVQGKIQSVRNLELLGFTGEHKEHVLARIRTDQGENIRADLGPRSGLSDLNLKEGESVSVQGTVGTINDRPVLMADEVSAGGKTAQVRLPEGLGHRRIHAQILSTRTANLKKQDGEQMIAHLRLLNGQQVDALLGPKDKLGDLNIHEGDSLDILAHPGQLNSEPVLVAEQVHLGGKVVDINRPQGQDDQQFNTQDSGSSDANNSK